MNIGVASPRLLIRKSLCALITQLNGCQVVLDLATPLDNLELIRKSRLDILLMDAVNLRNGSKVISQLCSLLPGIKILFLSDSTEEDCQIRAIREGARGYISENCDPGILEKALKLVAKGEIWLSHRLASRIIGQFLASKPPESGNNAKLSRREQEILALLAQGYANKEIANLLSVSYNTIKSQMAKLYRKIHADNRLEAVLYCFSARQDGGNKPLSKPGESCPVR